MTDRYEKIAEECGVELAPFTTNYLQLYIGRNGVKLLKDFIRKNKHVRLISTDDLERFRKSEGEQTILI